MSTLFPKLITYESSNTGAYVDGTWIEGTKDLKTFLGSVQPASGKDIESLPTGRRDKGIVKGYAPTPLAVSEESGNTSGDVVHYDRRRWELIYEGGYQNGLVPHYKYMAQYLGLVE